MIEIDGSHGEGGGQILRTAVAMSALKGEPIRITKIRAGREKSGLRPQHLKGVEAVGLLCDAKIEGLEVGSGEVSFAPGKIKAGCLRVDVGTAGSLTLVLQALLPVALSAPAEVEVELVGGTDVSHSPSIGYFEHVFLPIIRGIGCEVELEVLKRGFYPKGGGCVKVKVKPWKCSKSLDLTERGRFEGIEIFSTATEHLHEQEVAERQIRGFIKKVSPTYEINHIHRLYVSSPSIGSSFCAVAKYENSRLGFCVLGERGLKAEDVGKMASEGLLSEMCSGACLDCHMGDQIIPYLSLAGGSVKVSAVTEHAKTNMEVMRKFGYHLGLDGCLLYKQSCVF